MGAGTRRYGAALLACSILSTNLWHFVVPWPLRKRQCTRTGRQAEGYFPGVELELEEPPNRGSLLEKLQQIPEDPTVGEHTEEVKLLREQTAILAQELRLLRELLQDGALADAIRDLVPDASIPPVPPVPPVQPVPVTSPAAPAAPAASAAPSARAAPAPEEQTKLSASSTPPADQSDELGMSSLLASQGSFRHPESLEALQHLSKRVVERRVEGELPLGNVPGAE